MSYLVAATTTELTSYTSWVYLHPVDGRMQLSPYPEFIPTREDALKALALAQDFYSDTDASAHYITVDGPDGPVRSSFAGKAHCEEMLIERHVGNCGMAGYITR